MNRTIGKYLSFLCLLLLADRSLAQNNEREKVTLDLKGTSIIEILNEMEKQTGYRFFYDTADFDSTRTNIKVLRQPYYTVLEEILSGTGITYSIDRYRNVFVGKGEAIHTG